MNHSLKIILFCLLTVAVASVTHAQSFVLQGKVTDENQNPLELVSVSVVKQGKVTLTSLKGEFTMTLQSEDSVAVTFSMIGYKSKTRILRHPRGKQTLLISLHEADNTLSEVNVTGTKLQTGQTESLKKEQLNNMASANGNAVEALVQSQAGVSTHSELFTVQCTWWKFRRKHRIH